MNELENPQRKEIERRARWGAIALTLRTALAQVIILGGTVVMARHLRPAEFGAFAIIQFVLAFISAFGDAGLGGALIQKKEHPTAEELSSVFFLQGALGLAVVVVAFLVGNALPYFWHDLPATTPFIMVAVAFNFLFTSLRVVPTLLMERELLFVRLSLLDTVVSALFYFVAAVLSLRGFGIWALGLGVFAQGLGGFVAAFCLRPYLPKLEFHWPKVRGLLRFGLALQGRGVMVLCISAVIPVVAGYRLGSEAVGYLNWAYQTAFFPLTFIDILGRVSFPLYSRILASGGTIRETFETQLRICTILTFFFCAMFLSIGEPLTQIIYSATWLPAVPLLQIYALAIGLGMVMNVLTPAFDAVGNPGEIFRQMVGIALATWIAVPIATWLFGVTGFALAFAAVMWGGALWAIWRTPKILGTVSIAPAFLGPAPAALLVFAVGHIWLRGAATSPWSLAVVVVLEVALFVLVLAATDRRGLSMLRSLIPERQSA